MLELIADKPTAAYHLQLICSKAECTKSYYFRTIDECEKQGKDLSFLYRLAESVHIVEWTCRPAAYWPTTGTTGKRLIP